MKARWWSQRFAPEGSAASEGIRKQLGTPKLDPLAVLVREAAQNSWDAKSTDKVTFKIKIDALSRAARESWTNLLIPEPSGANLGIEACLNNDDLVMLTVSDRGTSGLGGPLRADEASADSPDFVNLVRNVGEPRDKPLGGGTYGFGKGIFFTLSTVSTILVHSRCLWNGRYQNRLIGVSLGHSLTRDHVKHTGRHWWGSIAGDDIPDPLLDDRAIAVAHSLGLPAFDHDATGTDIVVIGANLGFVASDDETELRQRDPDTAGAFLASAMLWNLWPLLTADDNGHAAMSCEVAVNAQTIRVPEPAAVKRLRPFVEAHDQVRRQSGAPVTRRRPSYAEIGRFAAKIGLSSFDTDWLDDAAPFDGPARHCALMRQAGLIVKYVEGPALTQEGIQYGAVFQSASGVDELFASSEPPTHDDWVAEGLPEEGRRTVESALRSVRSRLDQFVTTTETFSDNTRRQPPLGQLSQRLATLLPGAPGEGGATKTPAPGRPGGGASKASVLRIIRGPRFVIEGVAKIVADIIVDDSPTDLLLIAAAEVILDGGRESEPPLGAGVPRVLGFQSAGGTYHAGDRFILTPHAPREWTVIVEPTPGAVVRLKVQAEPKVPNES